MNISGLLSVHSAMLIAWGLNQIFVSQLWISELIVHSLLTYFPQAYSCTYTFILLLKYWFFPKPGDAITLKGVEYICTSFCASYVMLFCWAMWKLLTLVFPIILYLKCCNWKFRRTSCWITSASAHCILY